MDGGSKTKLAICKPRTFGSLACQIGIGGAKVPNGGLAAKSIWKGVKIYLAVPNGVGDKRFGNVTY